MPYIGLNFAKEYLIPNYVGESLAALIPSVLSLIQGLGQDPGCYNYTNPDTNETELVPIDIIPTYSVQLYFFFMFGLLCISTTSFSLLNFSPYALKYRKPKSLNGDNKENFLHDGSKEVSSASSSFSEPSSSPKRISPDPKGSPTMTSTNHIDSINDSQSPLNQSNPNSSYVEVSTGSREEIILLTYTFFLSFFCYGVLPGLQSYSTLPYGKLSNHKKKLFILSFIHL